jgi:hypothetical protein
MVLKPEMCVLVLSYSFSHCYGDSFSNDGLFEFWGCVVQVYSVVLGLYSEGLFCCFGGTSCLQPLGD